MEKEKCLFCKAKELVWKSNETNERGDLLTFYQCLNCGSAVIMETPEEAYCNAEE